MLGRPLSVRVRCNFLKKLTIDQYMSSKVQYHSLKQADLILRNKPIFFTQSYRKINQLTDASKNASDTELFLQMLDSSPKTIKNKDASLINEDLDDLDLPTTKFTTLMFPESFQGYLCDLPSAYEQLLIFTKEQTAMTWAETIFSCGMLSRIPIMVIQSVSEGMFTRQMLHAEVSTQLQAEITRHKGTSDKAAVAKARKDLMLHMEKYRLPKPSTRLMLMLLHIGAIGIQGVAVHRLACSNYGNMIGDNFAWITHLAIVDPSAISPVLVATTVSAYFCLFNLRCHASQTSFDKVSIASVYVIAAGLFVISYNLCKTLPAATNLCLAFNCGLSLLTMCAFRNAFIRKCINLPSYTLVGSKNVDIRKLISPKIAEILKKRKAESDMKVLESTNKLKLLFTDRKKFVEQYDTLKQQNSVRKSQ